MCHRRNTYNLIHRDIGHVGKMKKEELARIRVFFFFCLGGGLITQIGIPLCTISFMLFDRFIGL